MFLSYPYGIFSSKKMAYSFFLFLALSLFLLNACHMTPHPALQATSPPSDSLSSHTKQNTQKLREQPQRASIAPPKTDNECLLQSSLSELSFTHKGTLTIWLYNRGIRSCRLHDPVIRSKSHSSFSISPEKLKDEYLAPNGRIALSILFKPQSHKQVQGQLVLQHKGIEQPHLIIHLSGKPTHNQKCQLEWSKKELLFPLTSYGKKSQLKLSVTNVGWGTCFLKKLAITQKYMDKPEFQLIIPATAQEELPPSTRQEWLIAFHRRTNRAEHLGKLLVYLQNEQNPSYEIQLRGKPGNSCLQFLTSTIHFGLVEVGCSSKKHTLVIYHTGQKGCRSSIELKKFLCARNDCKTAINRSFQIEFPLTFRKQLKPYQKTELHLLYQPTSQKEEQHLLEIQHDEPNQSPLRILLQGKGVIDSFQTDIFKQPTKTKVDILFLVSDSCGTSREVQDRLGKHFQGLFVWAQRLQMDYHVGVVGTDTDGRHYPPGCLHGTPKFISSTTKNPIQVFSRNVKLGGRGSPHSKGFEAMYHSLSSPNLMHPKCNLHFYRKDAFLFIVMALHKQDESPRSLSFYSQFLNKLKNPHSSERVHVSAMTAPSGGCKPSDKLYATYETKYGQLVKKHRGRQESICVSKWTGGLHRLARHSLGSFVNRSSIILRKPADERTIQVQVNGRTLKKAPSDGWGYNAQYNTIQFSPSQIPPPNSTIIVRYQVLCRP